MEVSLKFKLVGGSAISKKNMALIVVQDTQLCKGIIHPDIDPKTYRCVYRVKLETEGYIFREVTCNVGINGHHSTLRSLVETTLLSSKLRVYVEAAANV